MKSTEPKLKNSETIEQVLRWLAPTKIVTFVWEQGEPPECGRHLRCRIRSERTLELLTASGAPKGRQGIAQGEALGRIQQKIRAL